MSILGRKEIAQLKKELETSKLRFEKLESENLQLNEKCSRYQSALNQANKENETYKIKLSEGVSTAPNDTDNEYSKLKEQCHTYKIQLDNANREIENYKQKLLDSQKREKEMEDRYIELADHTVGAYSDDLNDVDAADSQDRKDPIYNITDQVRDNPEYMATLYCSKNSFLSPNEFKMYTLLENFAYNYCADFGSLSIFANTRLADFTKLFESNYIGEKDSFSKKTENKPKKKAVCEIIDKFMPNFNNQDYKLAFLYPLLRMHVDFLICADSEEDDNITKPILAIELYGSEHDKNSANPNWKTIFNDSFKKSLFSYKNNAMGVRLLIIKNEELENEDKLEKKIYDAVEKCLQNPPKPVGNKKWNNKVYVRKNGQHYIFIDDIELNITDEEAKILNYYIKDMSDFFDMSNIFQN